MNLTKPKRTCYICGADYATAVSVKSGKSEFDRAPFYVCEEHREIAESIANELCNIAINAPLFEETKRGLQ